MTEAGDELKNVVVLPMRMPSPDGVVSSLLQPLLPSLDTVRRVHAAYTQAVLRKLNPILVVGEDHSSDLKAQAVQQRQQDRAQERGYAQAMQTSGLMRPGGGMYGPQFSASSALLQAAHQPTCSQPHVGDQSKHNQPLRFHHHHQTGSDFISVPAPYKFQGIVPPPVLDPWGASLAESFKRQIASVLGVPTHFWASGVHNASSYPHRRSSPMVRATDQKTYHTTICYWVRIMETFLNDLLRLVYTKGEVVYSLKRFLMDDKERPSKSPLEYCHLQLHLQPWQPAQYTGAHGTAKQEHKTTQKQKHEQGPEQDLYVEQEEEEEEEEQAQAPGPDMDVDVEQTQKQTQKHGKAKQKQKHV